MNPIFQKIKKFKLVKWFQKLKILRKRTLILIISSLVVVTAGIITVIAVSNRGNEPFIYLKLDEGQGSIAYDATSNNNDATITGAVWANEDDCVTGKCLYFDGSGDYVEIGDFDL